MLRGKDGNGFAACQRQHIFIGHLAADKDDAAYIQHFRCADDLRVTEPGDKHGTFAAEREHIAHHIGGKYILGVQVRQFLPVEKTGVKYLLHFFDRHNSSSLDPACGSFPVCFCHRIVPSFQSVYHLAV